MDLKELRKIVELMNEHGLTYFDMSKEGFHLKLKKGQDLESLRGLLSALPFGGYAQPAAPAPATSLAGPAVEAAVEAAVKAVADGEEISSPMVGTFYRKPTPDSPSFVNVGDVVSEGQTLCIIEAMKVMNEITAERSGTIIAVIAEDGNPVQFGDPLFRIK